MAESVELLALDDGRTFAPAAQVPLPEWPCTSIRRQQPTLTLKDNDLFLITDTLGNISGCLDDQMHNLTIGQTLLDLEFERSSGATACRVVRKRGNLRVVIEA